MPGILGESVIGLLYDSHVACSGSESALVGCVIHEFIAMEYWVGSPRSIKMGLVIS